MTHVHDPARPQGISDCPATRIDVAWQLASPPTPASAGDTPASAGGAAPIGQATAPGASSSGGGSLSWLAYAIGAVLVLDGLGLIGALVWRRRPQRPQPDWDEPQQYGEPAHPHTPTQIIAYDVSRQAGGPDVHGTPGVHTAPTAQYPIAQHPRVDPAQAWGDPPTGR